MNVLISHPSVGSIWLTKAIIKEGYIIGEAWDTTNIGSSYLPIDYPGERSTMSFPITCIRKKEGEING